MTRAWCLCACIVMFALPVLALTEEEIELVIQRGLSASSLDEAPPFLIVAERSPAPGSRYIFMMRGCRQWISNLVFLAKQEGTSPDRERVNASCLGHEKVRIAVLGQMGGPSRLHPPVTALSLEADGVAVDPVSTELDVFGEGTGTAAFDADEIGSAERVAIVATLDARQRLPVEVPGAILAEIFGPRNPGEGATVATAHYSFRVPPSRDWRVEKLADPWETVILSQKRSDTPTGPILAEIKLMRNVIVDEELRALTARRNADNVRNMEKEMMLEAGVNQGLYELSDPKLGEEKIGDKIFYFMDYMTRTSTDRQWSSLYLYFPREVGNEAFLMVHYSEIVPVEFDSFEHSKTELFEVLGTLSLH